VNSMPVVGLRSVGLQLGGRVLFRDLSLEVAPGEFLAVLGPNGAGKTSLLRLLLGLIEPTSGDVSLLGREPRRSRARVGYIPQHRAFDAGVPLRAIDVVRLAVDGTRWGLPLPRSVTKDRVHEALVSTGADSLARRRVGLLSGGEQQRVRLAQAIASRPRLILCDEPLSSLDLSSQRVVVHALDRCRRETGAAIVFVTHDVNPVLSLLDRVLYLGEGRSRVGSPEDVLRSEVLSDIYRSRVDVLRVGGRLVIAGAPESDHQPGVSSLAQRRGRRVS
jgi:zinc/manganese transport system ATP-binding protein